MTVILPEPETPAAEPVIVTVDTGGDDSGGTDLAMTVGEHEARLTALEGRTATVETVAEIADDTAELALEVAVDAGPEPEEVAAEIVAEEVAEAAESEPDPEPEPDNTPGKTHWLTRPAHEWRNSA